MPNPGRHPDAVVLDHDGQPLGRIVEAGAQMTAH
jgi:hypothetical protein